MKGPKRVSVVKVKTKPKTTKNNLELEQVVQRRNQRIRSRILKRKV